MMAPTLCFETDIVIVRVTNLLLSVSVYYFQQTTATPILVAGYA